MLSRLPMLAGTVTLRDSTAGVPPSSRQNTAKPRQIGSKQQRKYTDRVGALVGGGARRGGLGAEHLGPALLDAVRRLAQDAQARLHHSHEHRSLLLVFLQPRVSVERAESRSLKDKEMHIPGGGFLRRRAEPAWSARRSAR
jgi:hypothetical protein